MPRQFQWNRVSRNLKRVAVLFLLVILIYGIHIKADVWPLLLTGDSVPATANFRFNRFGEAVVNTSGTIAFNATFTTPDNASGDGIFKIEGGKLTPVMMEGQPVPGAPDSAFGESGNPHINGAGDIVFRAYLSGHASAFFQGIFLKSGDALQDVVDLDTTVPDLPEEHFAGFFQPQINDRGDIAFGATLVGGSVSNGIFVLSNGSLQLLASSVVGTNQSVNHESLSLNNRGDIAFLSSAGISIFSAGSVTTAITFPQPVPSTNYVMTYATSPSINDDGDVMFVGGAASQFTGRGSSQFQVGVLRWRNGTLEKIVATGDPVPGFPGAVFDTNFLNTRANQSGVVFFARLRQSGSSNFGLIEDFHDGQLTTIASENQSVDDIGTFDSLSSANFDPHQGPLILFPAGSALSPSIGLYAATAASQYTLRFPQIADGGSASKGGWRTRFDIANRSTVAATATISFYDDNGAPINLSIAGQQQTQTMITVPALGVAQVQTDGGAQLKTGWALLQSDQNLSGIAIFSLLDDSGNLINEVGVPAALALRSMSVFTQAGSNTSTGVALANPNSSLTNVTLVLKDSASAELARTSMNISPMGHIARYVGELFPGVTLGNFEGRIDVFATQPVAAVTLRQRELVFTSLPIIP